MKLSLAEKQKAEERRRRAEDIGRTIVYMTEAWQCFHDAEFLGWKEVDPSYTFGTKMGMGGKDFTAVHVFNTGMDRCPGRENEPFYWGDDPRDTKEAAIAKPWVLMFYGCDNSSCFQRFTTKEEAVAHYHEVKLVVASDYMFYNS